MRLKFARVCVVCLLAGCATPPVSLSEPGCPASAPLAVDRWWRQFADAGLDALMEESLRCNVDLLGKAFAAEKARIVLGRSDVRYQAGIADKLAFPPGGGMTTQASAHLSAAYEVDLWGRLASEHRADYWDAQAREFDRRAYALSLTAEVAQRYWQIAAQTRVLALVRENLATQRQLLALTEAGVKAGARPPGELWLAERTVLSAGLDVGERVRRLEEAKSALARLLDRPAAIDLDKASLPVVDLPPLAAGLSSSLLDRRPDIAAVKARLQRDAARTEQAQAEFMPSFSLTGALGAGSADLGRLLGQGTASLAATLALPFVDWNRQDIRLKQARIDVLDARQNYRRALHQALREVDDSLRLRRNLQEESEGLRRQLDSAENSHRLAGVRHRVGVEDKAGEFQALLLRRRLEMALLNNRLQQLQNLAVIYKAFGGAPEG